MSLPYAETVNYWKTGRSSPDTWIDKTKRQIEAVGGVVRAERYGSETFSGRAAFMLTFTLGEDSFKVVWPVLQSETGDEAAARRQAATMLYHDIKAKCISSAVLGARTAFFAHLELPDGRMAMQLSAPELVDAVPRQLLIASNGEDA